MWNQSKEGGGVHGCMLGAAARTVVNGDLCRGSCGLWRGRVAPRCPPPPRAPAGHPRAGRAMQRLGACVCANAGSSASASARRDGR